MITRAILSLLKHNNRVNLPTLGAIIKQQDFSQSLFFNQFIKYDDGILSSYLTKIEMLSEEESQATIHGFIEDIQNGLRSGGRFEIKELGIFCYVDNRLELLNEKEYARFLALSNAHALSELPEQPKKRDDNGEVPHLSDPKEEEQEKLNANIEEASECDDSNEALSSSSCTEHSEITHDGSKTLKEAPHGSTAFAGAKKNFRDSSRPLKFIRVAIPLIVVGLVLIRLSLPIPGGHPATGVAIDSARRVRADSVSRSTSASSKNSPSLSVPVSGLSDASAIEEARKGTEGVSVYHVIIGAFRFENNADKLVAEQLIRGHAVSKLGKRNGYYLVSYESTTDVWLAKKICKDLKAFYPEVWLDKQE
ncbi:SPOR domain-containing protein [Chryseolinea soli]|uniref:SPOR domain-containing protein n=1 Tax=Chryseolinea soli TaxID=2321403 RepID=A0A385SM15_9BACT|nr:SPOR domain-containing protein [Chryseolinea soli]AYB32793.1 SPOR domain-containing protein [Chryseolinea soli]